jgi:hypothetical protein
LLSFLNDYSVSAGHLDLFVTSEQGVEPIVVLTANESREIQQPTQRRCVVVPVTTPTVLDEDEILGITVPELHPLCRHFVLLLAMRLRSESLGLTKPLSISEVIDFARAVAYFEPDRLTPDFVEAHVPYLAKNRKDQYLLGLKMRACFDWTERQLRAAEASSGGTPRLLRDIDARQLDSRRKRDEDLSL